MKNFTCTLPFLIIFMAGTSSVLNYVLVDSPDFSKEERARPREFEKQHAYAIRRCTQLHKVDLDDILNTLCHFKVPISDNFPCWYYCFLEVFDIIKGKRINWNKAKEFTKLRLMDERYNQGVEDLYSTCEEDMKYISDSLSDCDYAVEYIYCQKRNWVQSQLPLYKQPSTARY